MNIPLLCAGSIKLVGDNTKNRSKSLFNLNNKSKLDELLLQFIELFGPEYIKFVRS